MSERVERRRSVWICLGLAVAVLLLYWPVLDFAFTNLDDPAYVLDNPHVLAGLTGKGLVWAMVTRAAEFWHPLTWLSHMVDCQIYGLKAGGHHVTNVLLHLANTLLLFGVLRQMSGAVWRSGLVAGLFALHPLHVETVAWVADRKDVLSTLFWLLTLWAYGRYVGKSEGSVGASGPPLFGSREGRSSRFYYILALGFYVLGLMSKPMLVTLPFVLLLLDYWPLRRFELAALTAQPTTLLRLVREKVPFFGLTVVGSVVAFIAQKGGGGLLTLTQLSMGERVANALISYVRYLGKTVWPSGLAVYYPHPGVWPWWEVGGALVLLAGVTVIAIGSAGKRPYLVVGWLWYVGTLVPVIGLVQIGSHALADRYTYVPLIGIFVMAVWGVGEGVAEGRWRWGWVSFWVLAGCLGCSWVQVRYWRNSIVLFEHTLAVTKGNALAHNNLGSALFQAGRVGEAVGHYEEALRLKPDFPEAHNNMGIALFQQNQVPEAIGHLEQVLQLEPGDADAHYNLGKGLLQLGRAAEAVGHLEQVLRLKPEDVEAHNNLAVALFQLNRAPEAIQHLNQALVFKPDYFEAQNNLGKALLQMGQLPEAIEHLMQALRLRPNDAQVLNNLGTALFRQGKAAEAIGRYEQALRLKPEYGDARINLGLAWLQLGESLAGQGKWAEAIQQYEQVIHLNPGDARAHDILGLALSRQGRFAEAVGHFSKALEIDPGLRTAQNNLAWLLATCREAAVRDGARSVELAEKANQSAGGKDPGILDTLAAAYAEAGRFNDAVRTAAKAIELARGGGQTEAARRIETRLQLYQSGGRYREGATGAP